MPLAPTFAVETLGSGAGAYYAFFAAWLAFCCASWVLLRCPTLLHRRKPRKANDPRFQATHIAHRGCRLEGVPENTVAAMKHALACGADILEFDVWLTQDGQVVIFHDATLARMCGGGKGADIDGKGVADMAYADLPAIHVDQDGEHWGVTAANRGEAQRIPLLSELLACIPLDKPLIIEFKQKEEALIHKVHDLICESGRKEHVMWFSLVEEINQALRRYDPTIPTIVSVASMLKTILLYYAGLLPFVALPEDVFGVPVDRVDYARVREQKVFKGLPDAVCRVLAYMLGGKPPRALIPPGLFAHLRARGMPVLFLGVNDEEDLAVAKWAGATAVLTDRPSWLQQQIKEGRVKLQKLVE